MKRNEDDNMRKVTMARIAALTVAATMAMSMMAIPGAAITTTNVSNSSTADALANLKYTNNSVDMRTAYYAAQANVTYTYSGDIAVKDNGEITFVIDDFTANDFTTGLITKATVTIKSGSTTGTITLVSDKALEDTAKCVYYSEALTKLGTSYADDSITVKINDFTESFDTLLKTNNKLEVATESTEKGMTWDDSTVGWTIKKARNVDSCTVVLTAETATNTTPTSKELSQLTEKFEAVTMSMTGDVREYTVQNNKLYVAAKYDSTKPAAALTGDALTKKQNMESLTAYVDFLNYIEMCANNSITVVRNTTGINDYIKNYLVLQAYRTDLETTHASANDLTDYWYDSYTETTPTTAEVAAMDAYDDTAGNIVLKDIRDSANTTEFNTIRTNASKSNGVLNAYIADLNYPAIVKDTDAIYTESSDYTYITTYAMLSTALNNVTTALESLTKVANVAVNDLTGITNTSNKSNAVTEAKPFAMPANNWVNIGTIYNSNTGYPILAQLNTMIGTNKGVKVRFMVDETTVPTTSGVTTPSIFGTGATQVGAARLRINGLYATDLSQIATYDATNKWFEFDWDAVTGGNANVWMLEMATYDALKLTGLSVAIPDQDAYLEAIGTKENEETKDNTLNQIESGESKADDTEIIDEDPAADTETEVDTSIDGSFTDETDATTDVDNTETDANVDDDVTVVTPEVVDTNANANPNTGTTSTGVGIATVLTMLTGAILSKRKR